MPVTSKTVVPRAQMRMRYEATRTEVCAEPTPVILSRVAHFSYFFSCNNPHGPRPRGKGGGALYCAIDQSATETLQRLASTSGRCALVLTVGWE